MEYWSTDEKNLCLKYFNSSTSELTLFQKIHALNPNRTYEAVMRQLRRMKATGLERGKDNALKTLRVGYLDIESSDLRADWGYMLTWYIKTEGKNEYYSARIKQSEILSGQFDKRITIELLEALKNYDIVWTHYGSDWRFDVPFIRTRAFAHELQDQLPKRMDLFVKDTYPIVKKKLKLSSNRLANILEILNIKEKKSPVSPKLWQLARIGNEAALDYVDNHNKRDVQVLEKVHQKIRSIDDTPLRSV